MPDDTPLQEDPLIVPNAESEIKVKLFSKHSFLKSNYNDSMAYMNRQDNDDADPFYVMSELKLCLAINAHRLWFLGSRVLH